MARRRDSKDGCRGLTRRELVRAVGLSALAAPLAAGRSRVASGRVGVARIEPPAQGRLQPEAAAGVVGRALVAATGAGSVEEAAASLFAPDDVVGIKVNCLAGRQLSPRVELVEALVEIVAGEARILSSPCPHELCVKMGAVRMPGRAVVCVPNRVVVTVVGSGPTPTDAVTR